MGLILLLVNTNFSVELNFFYLICSFFWCDAIQSHVIFMIIYSLIEKGFILEKILS